MKELKVWVTQDKDEDCVYNVYSKKPNMAMIYADNTWCCGIEGTIVCKKEGKKLFGRTLRKGEIMKGTLMFQEDKK